MTCKDCIHNEVCKYGENRSNGMYCTGDRCKQFKDRSRYVVREKGEWIEHYNEAYGTWHYDCPFCDDGYAMKQRDLSPSHFCPNCGADMRKEN